MPPAQSQPSPPARPFVGIDGTRGRWIAVALGPDGAFAAALLADTLMEIVDGFPAAKAYGIDVPIGLPKGLPAEASRAAELEAKMLLGPRRATVFPVPPMAVLQQPTYAAARAKAVELTGKSLSAQSYALRHNIVEAQELVDTLGPERSQVIHEVHPELGFRSLVGRVLLSNKRTWNGSTERRESLERAGIVLPTHLGSAGDTPVDDVLDAAVCAWVAQRIASGEAKCVPAEPAINEDGRAVGIWF